MADPSRWMRSRVGVRVASALSAALVVAVALVVGGAALILLIGRSLSDTVNAAGSAGGDRTVLVPMPLGGLGTASNTVLISLLVGVPVLAAVAGAATYLFAGRALRPVEVIRARIATITESDLAQRVPVPAAGDEIGRLAEAMNEMISRLEHAQAVQRRLVADAGHELRSPLATIAAGLEQLQRDHATDPTVVAALRAETERVTRLVEGLLLHDRLDEQGPHPRREEAGPDGVAEAGQSRPGEDGMRTGEPGVAGREEVADEARTVEHPLPLRATPIRDVDARRDPPTAPWRLPVARPPVTDPRGAPPVTDPRGGPVTDPRGAPPVTDPRGVPLGPPPGDQAGPAGW